MNPDASQSTNRVPDTRAIRAVVTGAVQGVGFRDATRRRAGELGLMGWVRNEPDGSVGVHAEGEPAAIDALLAFLHEGPRGAAVGEVALSDVRVEGHEQFAVRGVRAVREQTFERLHLLGMGDLDPQPWVPFGEPRQHRRDQRDAGRRCDGRPARRDQPSR